MVWVKLKFVVGYGQDYIPIYANSYSQGIDQSQSIVQDVSQAVVQEESVSVG
jgi:hypothetical protein